MLNLENQNNMDTLKKQCRCCNLEKETTEFYPSKQNKDGYVNICKLCDKNISAKWRNKNREKKKAQGREYYKKNSEVLKKKAKNYMKNNKKERSEYAKNYYKEHREEKLEYQKKYINGYRTPKKEYIYKEPIIEKLYLDGKEAKKCQHCELVKILDDFMKDTRQDDGTRNTCKNCYRKLNNDWHKEKIETDLLFKIERNIRALVAFAFKSKGYKKHTKTAKILGCSYDELIKWIESKWEPWMNWENYGLYNGKENFGWDFDHTIPIDAALSETELIALSNYKNLSPLCSFKNRILKRAKYSEIDKQDYLKTFKN